MSRQMDDSQLERSATAGKFVVECDEISFVAVAVALDQP